VLELKNQLHEDWKYNKASEELSRVISLRSMDNDPIRNFSAVFEFVNKLGNIAINQGHSPKAIHLLPNRAQVEIKLRTPALQGLSYSDFNYAMYADGAVQTVKSKWKIQ
jgi:pterin-4a-carbinolamine dehydratase